MDMRKESIADIVAEMRKGSPVNPNAYMIGLPDETTVLGCGDIMRKIQIKTVTVKELADRIEEAAKRENDKAEADALSVGGIVEASRHKPGNAAAMRKALQSFVEYSEVVCKMGMFNRNSLVAITEKARAALAAPPRNCDAGTAEEQSERFHSYCINHSSECDVDMECCRCPLEKVKARCEFAWAQMPYNEGSAE